MNRPRTIFQKFAGYFIRGILLTIPFWLTIYIISWALTTVDSIFMVKKIPGAGIGIIIVGITLIGYIGSTIIMKSSLDVIEKVTLKIPLVNIIYSSFKEMTTAFVGKKKFNVPVLMVLNKNPYVIKVGFITQPNLSEMDLTDMVSVYIPGAYTLSGDLYLVKKEDIIPLSASSTDVMRFAMSGGITSIAQSKTSRKTTKTKK